MDPKPRIAKIFTLTCEEDTFLSSESLDRPLTITERVASGVHHRLCPGCKHFHKQILLIRHAARLLARDEAVAGSLKLPCHVRETIRRAMRDESG